MRAQTRNCGVSILAGNLELDIAIELFEADVAAHLGARRAEQPSDAGAASSAPGVVGVLRGADLEDIRPLPAGSIEDGVVADAGHHEVVELASTEYHELAGFVAEAPAGTPQEQPQGNPES